MSAATVSIDLHSDLESDRDQNENYFDSIQDLVETPTDLLFITDNRTLLTNGRREISTRARGVRRRGRETMIKTIALPNDGLSRIELIFNSTETNEPVYNIFDENSSSLAEFASYYIFRIGF